MSLSGTDGLKKSSEVRIHPHSIFNCLKIPWIISEAYQIEVRKELTYFQDFSEQTEPRFLASTTRNILTNKRRVLNLVGKFSSENFTIKRSALPIVETYFDVDMMRCYKPDF